MFLIIYLSISSTNVFDEIAPNQNMHCTEWINHFPHKNDKLKDIVFFIDSKGMC